MLRILIVRGSYPPMPCGVGDYTASLANALHKSGKVKVGILIGPDVRPISETIEFLCGPGWRLRSAPKMLKTITAWRPDIVHLQFPTQGYAGYLLPWFLPLLLRMSGIPIIQTWHEYLPMGTRLATILICIASGTVIVVRPNYINSLSAWYRLLLTKSRLVLVPGASSVPRSRLLARELAHLHEELAAGRQRVVTYFGFAYPKKGVELLFKIADPKTDRIVLLCDLREADPYQKGLLEMCQRPPWTNSIRVTGFLPIERVADILAASDAVVLPFPGGGGDWNSTLNAVLAQGTLAISASLSQEGYDP